MEDESEGDYTSEQSTQQSLNQQKIPPKLVDAVNTLREYLNKPHLSSEIKEYLDSVKEEFTPALVPNTDTAANILKKYYDQRHTNPNIQRFFEDLKEEFAAALVPNTDTGSSSGSQERKVRRKGGYTVKVHTVTTGETFGADEVLLSRVKCKDLEVERTDQQRCNVIILFCPIISRVGSDVDAAMSEISVSASILSVSF